VEVAVTGREGGVQDGKKRKKKEKKLRRTEYAAKTNRKVVSRRTLKKRHYMKPCCIGKRERGGFRSSRGKREGKVTKKDSPVLLGLSCTSPKKESAPGRREEKEMPGRRRLDADPALGLRGGKKRSRCIGSQRLSMPKGKRDQSVYVELLQKKKKKKKEKKKKKKKRKKKKRKKKKKKKHKKKKKGKKKKEKKKK